MPCGYNFLEATPNRFLSYAHIVTDVIISFSQQDNTDYDMIKQYWIGEFTKAGIKAYNDNKIVFGVTMSNGQEIFIGFYDNTMRVGLSFRKSN